MLSTNVKRILKTIKLKTINKARTNQIKKAGEKMTSHPQAAQKFYTSQDTQEAYAPENNGSFFNYHDHLIQSNLLTSQQMAIAKEEQQLSGTSLRSVILKMGFLTEETLMDWLGQEFSYASYCPEEHDTDASLCNQKEEILYGLRAAPSILIKIQKNSPLP